MTLLVYLRRLWGTLHARTDAIVTLYVSMQQKYVITFTHLSHSCRSKHLLRHDSAPIFSWSSFWGNEYLLDSLTCNWYTMAESNRASQALLIEFCRVVIESPLTFILKALKQLA